MCKCESNGYTTRMSGASYTMEMGQMYALKYFRMCVGHNRIIGLASLLSTIRE